MSIQKIFILSEIVDNQQEIVGTFIFVDDAIEAAESLKKSKPNSRYHVQISTLGSLSKPKSVLLIDTTKKELTQKS
jgi:hypothetical protein